MTHVTRSGSERAGLARRTFLAGSGVAAIAAVGAPPASAALPVVDMEKVLLAAQWDPVKTGTGITLGAGPSVTLVEQALVARGFLDGRYVDGHFGTVTRTAYAAWQRSLGYSGLGATGLPGKASLTSLGAQRYSLTRPVAPGARTTLQGFPFNARTAAMLTEARRLAGKAFVVEQGSYSPGVDPTSSGTHDGGGAADLDAEALTAQQRTAAVTALRRVGFAAWLRNPRQGDWPWHIHVVATNDPDLSLPAQKQVGAYHEGRNGLANNAADDGPQVPKVTWEQYLRNRA